MARTEIILIDPKYPHNVGAAVRLASCYGIERVWCTGDRAFSGINGRLPREERMKAYRDVEIVRDPNPLDHLTGLAPIGVEVRENAERLSGFLHPVDAVYVFGPEDGAIPKSVLARCHQFVVIPVRHCLNLATALATVLWDRHLKLGEEETTPGEFEGRGLSSVELFERGDFVVGRK